MIFLTIKEICAEVSGPVSAEVTATDYNTMLKERAMKLADIADNVAVKVPLTPDGLRLCKTLSEIRHYGECDSLFLACTSATCRLLKQAQLSFHPFVGRLDDLGQDGMNLISDIITLYDNYDFDTEILVASARGPQHVVDAAITWRRCCHHSAKNFG